MHPANWRSRGRGGNETANAAVNNGTTFYQPALVDIDASEVSCYVVDNTFDVVKDPNVFVFESGRSQHCVQVV